MKPNEGKKLSPMVAQLNPINALMPLIGFLSSSLDNLCSVDVMFCLGILLKTFLQPGALPQALLFNPFGQAIPSG